MGRSKLDLLKKYTIGELFTLIDPKDIEISETTWKYSIPRYCLVVNKTEVPVVHDKLKHIVIEGSIYIADIDFLNERYGEKLDARAYSDTISSHLYIHIGKRKIDLAELDPNVVWDIIKYVLTIKDVVPGDE